MFSTVRIYYRNTGEKYFIIVEHNDWKHVNLKAFSYEYFQFCISLESSMKNWRHIYSMEKWQWVILFG